MRDLFASLTRKSPAAQGAAAWKLAEQGRFREAVEAAEKAGRGEPRLEEALVVWRNRAVAQADGKSGRASWPPTAADPFPDAVDRIPEIEATKLTPEIMEGAILHHGSLIVRGLFGRPVVDMLVAGIDRALTAFADQTDRGAASSEWHTPAAIDDPELVSTRPFLGRTSLLMADSPSFLAMWLGLLRSSGVYDIVARHFGENPVLSAKKTTLYRVPPDANAQWHQDGAFLGAGIRTVNLWTALSDCGVDAPGLDIVPWRVPAVVQTHTHGALFDWSVGDGFVREMAAARGPISSPVFRPGDAILFDQLCLHRTGVAPGMTKTRYAIECWMFSPSYYHDRSPLLI